MADTEIYKRNIFRAKTRPYFYHMIRGKRVHAHVGMDDRFEVTICLGGSFICPDCKGTSGHLGHVRRDWPRQVYVRERLYPGRRMKKRMLEGISPNVRTRSRVNLTCSD